MPATKVHRVLVSLFLAVAAALLVALWPASAQAVESDLAFVSLSGDSVTGNASSGYTVYIRDGDTADVVLKVKNNSGHDLEFVTMSGYPSYPAADEGDDPFEPIWFPPYRSDKTLVTGAENMSSSWYTSETTGVKYPGYWIEAGASPTFRLRINSGDLATGTYNWNIQLGRLRWDYEEHLIVVDPTLSYKQWDYMGETVEEVYSGNIPIKVVVYNQTGAALTAGTGSSVNLTPLPSTGIDFGTIDLATATGDQLTGSQTVTVVNGAAPNSALVDSHGNLTSIKVVFDGENTCGLSKWEGPFTFWNGSLYDTNWAPWKMFYVD